MVFLKSNLLSMLLLLISGILFIYNLYTTYLNNKIDYNLERQKLLIIEKQDSINTYNETKFRIVYENQIKLFNRQDSILKTKDTKLDEKIHNIHISYDSLPNF